MRHHNPTIRNWHGHRVIATAPTQQNYKYNKPTPKRKYIQVISYIAKNLGCGRLAIQRAVWGRGLNSTAHEMRGYMSATFANLLYNDFIDYNKNYEYRVTEKGYALLGRALTV